MKNPPPKHSQQRSSVCSFASLERVDIMKFSELVRLLERNGFHLVKERGSIRFYGKTGHMKLIRVDFHGTKEVPAGTCYSILRAAGLSGGGR